MPTQQR